MAEEQGNDEQLGNGEDNLPQVGMIAQYVKDLSFENPNAPQVYQWQGQPRIDVQFNIGAQTVGDDVHEVALKVDVTAMSADKTAFQVELVYAGLFGIRNVPEDQVAAASCSPRRRACCSPSPAACWPTRSATATSRRCCSSRSISARSTCSRPQDAQRAGQCRAGRRGLSDHAYTLLCRSSACIERSSSAVENVVEMPAHAQASRRRASRLRSMLLDMSGIAKPAAGKRR